MAPGCRARDLPPRLPARARPGRRVRGQGLAGLARRAFVTGRRTRAGATPSPAHSTIAAVRIAYRDDSGRFVEADGTVRDPEQPPEAQIWVPVERDGTTIAALAVDPALVYDPELVGSATTATLVAIEGGRLEGELRASLRRLVDVGDHERRRIERDLHDSAQQRLLALRVRLDLAGETLAHDPTEQEIVDELGREVDAAIEDIRELARGVYPPTLAAHGPAAAISAVIRRSGLRAVVRVGALPRLPEPIERTIYFCCLEALQNVAKHGGARRDGDRPDAPGRPLGRVRRRGRRRGIPAGRGPARRRPGQPRRSRGVARRHAPRGIRARRRRAGHGADRDRGATRGPRRARRERPRRKGAPAGDPARR